MFSVLFYNFRSLQPSQQVG